jgi:large subunit ribosomal protein L4
MKIPVLNLQNIEVENIEVPDEIFNVKWNPDLVFQALNAFLSNKRKPLANTKTRKDVSGGGKKPWRQKHTGRARHGSRRSPIWRGGGVVFGPTKEKKYSQKINSKMKKLALFSTLSKKLKENELKVLDDLKMDKPKTKEAYKALSSLHDFRKSLLFISSPSKKYSFLSLRNIPKVSLTTPQSVNIYDILKSKNIIFEKEALNVFINKYKKDNK